MSASTTVHGESPSCGYSGGEDIAEDLKKIAKAMNRKGKLRVPAVAAWIPVLLTRI